MSQDGATALQPGRQRLPLKKKEKEEEEEEENYHFKNIKIQGQSK